MSIKYKNLVFLNKSTKDGCLYFRHTILHPLYCIAVVLFIIDIHYANSMWLLLYN